MTREQRWIREQQRRLESTIELAKSIKAAVGPNTIRRAQRELATIKSIRAIVDVYAAGEVVRSVSRPSAGGRQP